MAAALKPASVIRVNFWGLSVYVPIDRRRQTIMSSDYVHVQWRFLSVAKCVESQTADETNPLYNEQRRIKNKNKNKNTIDTKCLNIQYVRPS